MLVFVTILLYHNIGYNELIRKKVFSYQTHINMDVMYHTENKHNHAFDVAIGRDYHETWHKHPAGKR